VYLKFGLGGYKKDFNQMHKTNASDVNSGNTYFSI